MVLSLAKFVINCERQAMWEIPIHLTIQVSAQKWYTWDFKPTRFPKSVTASYERRKWLHGENWGMGQTWPALATQKSWGKRIWGWAVRISSILGWCPCCLFVLPSSDRKLLLIVNEGAAREHNWGKRVGALCPHASSFVLRLGYLHTNRMSLIHFFTLLKCAKNRRLALPCLNFTNCVCKY